MDGEEAFFMNDYCQECVPKEREIANIRRNLIAWAKSAKFEIDPHQSPVGIIKQMMLRHCDERSYSDLALSGGLYREATNPDGNYQFRVERLKHAARQYIASHSLMRARFQLAGDATAYESAERALIEAIERLETNEGEDAR